MLGWADRTTRVGALEDVAVSASSDARDCASVGGTGAGAATCDCLHEPFGCLGRCQTDFYNINEYFLHWQY